MKRTKEDAERSVAARVETGRKAEHDLIEIVKKTVIVDKLVPPSAPAMRFCIGVRSQNNELLLEYSNGYEHQPVSIHPHAFGQLCEKVKLPMTYANMLHGKEKESWQVNLLCDNLNTLFYNTPFKSTQGQSPRFLHRIVNDQLRGFLSRRFNRYLASAPLLSAFVDVCRAQGAQPIDADSSAVRSYLKCILPTVYEPFPGEFICIGSEWSNSDFGKGKLTVCQTVWRVASGSSSVLDESVSRVHLGSIIQDSDLEISDETARKEVAAQQSAIADSVTQGFSTKTVDRLIQAMRVAHEENIPWNLLKANLSRLLSKVELEWMESILQTSKMGIIDLPPITFGQDNTPQPNSYWASAVVALLATETDDNDRKAELQRASGDLLSNALKS
jgi:hypothetical protein